MVLREIKEMLEKSTYDLVSFQREYNEENPVSGILPEKEIEKGSIDERGEENGSGEINKIKKEER